MDKPCASCPFLPTNWTEFNEIAKKLSAKCHQPEPDFFQCLTIRENIKQDAIFNGKLACHCAIYDKDMNMDMSKAIECAGYLQHMAENKPTIKKVTKHGISNRRRSGVKVRKS